MPKKNSDIDFVAQAQRGKEMLTSINKYVQATKEQYFLM